MTDTSTITVIVPAYNEAAGIADTLRSLLGQARRPERIVVVNDCSTDDTEAIALAFADRGVEVLTPPKNLGSKAKAQNFALQYIDSDLVLPLDGDTVLEPDYIEKLVPVFDDPDVSVASGCVLTQRQKTIWEKARQLEYLFGFHWYRPIQQSANSITVCSGCCTVFRRKWLGDGFPETTLTEDIYYTWQQHIAGRKAVYVHDAVARAAEPVSAKYMSIQLKRWKCGWFHGFRVQWLSLLRHKPMVAFWSALQFLETALAPLILILPILAIFVWDMSVWHVLLWWFIGDVITFWPPVLYGCVRRKYPVWKAITSYHAWYALKAINLRWDMHMFVREMILVPIGVCKPWTVYERGKA
jgi:cellulose synthase/poly-beta-1,6-N-acetylglucosamine synthase-like glycosyltransferase